MALGDGRHKLAVKADVREKIGKDVGSVVDNFRRAPALETLAWEERPL
jgi:hypothetical protein